MGQPLGNSKVGGGSDNGADWVGLVKGQNGEDLVVVAEFKPFKNGVAKLNDTVPGPQLSEGWLDKYLHRLTEERGDVEASAIAGKIKEAEKMGTLRRVVGGLDRESGEFRIVGVEFPE